MLTSIFAILLAVIPAILLLFFVVGKDKKQPEPPAQLVRAFLMGIVSVFVALILVGIIGLVVPFGNATVAGQVGMAFWGAAVPEELAKLLMLWLVLRKNKYFDEHLDGIVYAVMIGLGFATFENVMYMIENYDNWLIVGSTRALMAVPAHYAFAVFMGYFFSLAHFSPRRRLYNGVMALLVPVLLHGLYDMLLMVSAVVPEFLSVVLPILCVVLCYYMHKEALRRLAIHQQADSIIVPDVVEQSREEISDEIEYIEYEETKRDENDVDK
jgi:RsiW-degrading membrane proteinase PrsW (M82 family)